MSATSTNQMPHDPLPSPQKFQLPGIKPVLELLTTNPKRIDSVLCKKNIRTPEMLKIQELCRQHGIHYSLVEPQALDRLCRRSPQDGDSVRHQGVVARLISTASIELPALLADTPNAPLPIIVALDQVNDPGNVGTLARTLYALGGAGLLLPVHNGVHLGAAAQRSAAGALERLPVCRVTNLGHALDSCEEAGFTIYGAAAPSASSLNAFLEPLQFPAVIVLGNEGRGLRPGTIKRCSHLLHIPQAREFDSLNVAQAGAILLALASAHITSGSH